MMDRALVSCAVLLSLVACFESGGKSDDSGDTGGGGAGDSGASDGGASDGGGSDGGGGDGGTDGGAEGGSDGGGSDAWSFGAHPCSGYRVDALWMADTEVGLVGCGSTTDGVGLYGTVDGGLSWEAVETSPTNYFADFRVLSIHQSSDGLIYVGGVDTSSSTRVVSLDPSSSPFALELVQEAGSTVGSSFTAGTFRRSDSGYSVSESLTGTDLLYREADGDEWTEGYGWWGDHDSVQILDLEVMGDDFYGCGSTISQPPMVFLPPAGGMDGGFTMDIVELASGLSEYNGEMWDVDVDESGITVVGVNQDADVGMIYSSGADPWDASDWSAFEVNALFPDDATWVRGVCRGAGLIVAMGEFSIETRGFMLVSEDDGATFEDMTSVFGEGTRVPPLSRCQVFDDGTVAVAAGEGFFAMGSLN